MRTDRDCLTRNPTDKDKRVPEFKPRVYYEASRENTHSYNCTRRQTYISALYKGLSVCVQEDIHHTLYTPATTKSATSVRGSHCYNCLKPGLKYDRARRSVVSARRLHTQGKNHAYTGTQEPCRNTDNTSTYLQARILAQIHEHVHIMCGTVAEPPNIFIPDVTNYNLFFKYFLCN